MEQDRIITINGTPTRVWTYKQEHGYGCAECCNGDRCEDDCTAKYRRPTCPHCKGRGWIKEIPAADYAALQARCDRYEKALKEINGSGGKLIPPKDDMIAIANEALNGEGEKEVGNG